MENTKLVYLISDSDFKQGNNTNQYIWATGKAETLGLQASNGVGLGMLLRRD